MQLINKVAIATLTILLLSFLASCEDEKDDPKDDDENPDADL